MELTRTIRSSATGAYLELLIDSAAASSEFYHIDEIEVRCTDDQSENEQTSILHELVRAATQADIRQYLANNSFENATIGNSWLVSGSGTLNRDAADGLFGSVSGELIPGAAAEDAYQTVTFTGEDKLNNGESFLVIAFVKSTSAASGSDNFIAISERDSVAENDATSEAYVLAGGEDYKLAIAVHEITDADSDRLRVRLSAAVGDTVNIDGFALIRAKDLSLYVFQENSADGTAGVVDADDADTINYDRVGLDIDAYTLVHPFRRIEANESLWEHMKAMGESAIVEYLGAAACGTFQFKPRLGDVYEESVPSNLIPTNPRGIESDLVESLYNKLILHGVIIKKHEVEWMVWFLSGSGMYELEDTGKVAVTVANGATWPDADEFGDELIAEYGDTELTPATYSLPEPDTPVDVMETLAEWQATSPLDVIWGLLTELFDPDTWS